MNISVNSFPPCGMLTACCAFTSRKGLYLVPFPLEFIAGKEMFGRYMVKLTLFIATRRRRRTLLTFFKLAGRSDSASSSLFLRSKNQNGDAYRPLPWQKGNVRWRRMAYTWRHSFKDDVQRHRGLMWLLFSEFWTSVRVFLSISKIHTISNSI